MRWGRKPHLIVYNHLRFKQGNILMTKLILKRNPNMMRKKLERFKHEVRTQPIMSVITLALFSFAVSKCVLPEADAAVPVPEMVLVHTPDTKNYDLRVDPTVPNGSEDTVIDFGKLGKTSKVGPMMGAYFGVKSTKDRPAILPASMDVNWADNLQMLWNKKLSIRNVTPATRKNADKIVSAYATQERDTKTIQAFVSEVGEIVRDTQASIDYPSLCDAMRINDTSCGSYKKIMGRFNGQHIVAYGMTEIFPAQNGLYNFRALDTLLQHAGENYLDSIPALGDVLLSKGFYQLTSHAVRRDDSGNLGGVTFVDNYAGMKLPGSVLYITGKDSHKAAFEFSAYNIGSLIKSLNSSELKILSNRCSQEQLMEFIAVSHHQPSKAVRFGRRWVKEGCSKHLSAYLDDHLKEYALKTRINYGALVKYL